MIRQLCEALSHAHQQGILHRDIKPANCFVLRDMRLKMLDFGIAARMHDEALNRGLAGTHTHMAPELFTPVPQYTEGTDIWAAGVTLYHILTGTLPFTGRSPLELLWNIRNSPYAPLPDSFPRARELKKILERCLDKNPARRFESAREFTNALSAVEELVAEGYVDTIQCNIAEQSWWPTRIASDPLVPGEVSQSSAPTVRMFSWSVKARGRGATVRLAEYNEKIVPFVLAGSVAALSYSVFSMLGGDGFSSGLRWAWTIAAYGSGLILPVLVLVSLLLMVGVFWEQTAVLPICRRCKWGLIHQSRTTAYAYSKVSRTHAASDCLAALRENLWADALKLFSMHADLVPPDPGTKASSSALRLHLDFYACQCGDELALLNTEDRIGQTWSPREEITGAYRTQAFPRPRPSLTQRVQGNIKELVRTARLAAAPLHLRFAAFLILAGLLSAFEYYPQFPIILGWKAYRVPVVIQSNPPGHVCSTYGWSISQFTTPQTFRWPYASDHFISCRDLAYGDGKIYKFQGFFPRATQVPAGPPGTPAASDHDIRIRVDVAKDRWGRLTVNPSTPVYTAQYAFAGKYDFVAEARARQDAWEKQKALEKAATSDHGPAKNGQNRIVVTSSPQGLIVLIDGVRVVTPAAYSWSLGSYHALEIPAEEQKCCHGRAGDSRLYSGGRWNVGVPETSSRVHINWSAMPFPTAYTAQFLRLPDPDPEQASRKNAGSPPLP